jgi:hypothetical protein
VKAGGGGLRERYSIGAFEEAPELAREIDRYPRVHGALLVEEALRSGGGEHASCQIFGWM